MNIKILLQLFLVATPAMSHRLLRGINRTRQPQSPASFNAVDGERGPLRVGNEYKTHITNEGDSVILPTVTDLEKTAKWKVKKTGASYMALHFSNFDLEDGCEVTVSGKNKKDGYKMTGKGKMNSGTFWAQQVKEDDITVSCHCKGGSAQRMCHFNIDSYAAGYPNKQASGVSNGARELFPTVSRREAICGTNDKTLAVCHKFSHPTKYAKSRPVARLLINGSSACTGWLASINNHLITNEHCIGSAATAVNTDFEFMAEALNCNDSDGWFDHGGTVFSGASLVKLDAGLDYALVQINSGNPASTYGHMAIADRAAVVDEQICIPQHAGGRSKELGYESTYSTDGGVCHVNSFTSPCSGNGYQDVGYYCDTEGGSSGSPVLTADHKVIALHHCADCMNRGVPIHLVCDDIGQDAPEVCPTSCNDDTDCIYSNSCTNNVCTSGFCAFTTIPNCCGNGVCEVQVGENCISCPQDCTADLDCCSDNSDCNDGNSCTLGTCDGLKVCSHTTIANCCGNGSCEAQENDACDANFCPGDCPAASDTCQFDMGVPATGISSSTGGVKKYWVDVTQEENIRCSTSGPNGDADMYVRFDGEPEISTSSPVNACYGYSSSSNELCDHLPVPAGTMKAHVSVDAYATYSGLTLQCSTSIPTPAPVCGDKGASCSNNAGCCSNKCRGSNGNKTCK